VSFHQETLELDESTSLYKCIYLCKVRITLKDGRMLEVTGKATGGSRDRGTVIEFAKKNAVTDARKSAFQRMAIIVLGDEKVAVHFLDASLDEWEDEQPSTNSTDEDLIPL
jgi:recombination DNA repair RAD52 pathway protein